MMFNFKKQIVEIAQKIDSYKAKNLKLFATSSFQTHSIPLLHIISRVDNSIPVYFLDTGYHFSETLQFKEQIAELLTLNVINLTSPVLKEQQRDENGQLMFRSDPENCCYINKILPLKPILKEKDVWINGVRNVQTENRSRMKTEERTSDVLRYHPVLKWSNKMIRDYRQRYDLPAHPLEGKGYFSVGCKPCTVPSANKNNMRSGRWQGIEKTECGLHTELRSK